MSPTTPTEKKACQEVIPFKKLCIRNLQASSSSHLNTFTGTSTNTKQEESPSHSCTMQSDKKEVSENAAEDSHSKLLLDAASALTSLLPSNRKTLTPSLNEAESTDTPDLAIPEDNSQSPTVLTDDNKTQKTGRTKAIRFPVKLMNVLSCGKYEDIIAWNPDGLSFMVKKPDELVEKVLSLHFKEVKYTSFTRKLHRWGFVKILRGNELSTYCHKNFRKDDYCQCERMRCCSFRDVDQKESVGEGRIGQEEQTSGLLGSKLCLNGNRRHLSTTSPQLQEQLAYLQRVNAASDHNTIISRGSSSYPSDLALLRARQQQLQPQQKIAVSEANMMGVPQQPFDVTSSSILRSAMLERALLQQQQQQQMLDRLYLPTGTSARSLDWILQQQQQQASIDAFNIASLGGVGAAGSFLRTAAALQGISALQPSLSNPYHEVSNSFAMSPGALHRQQMHSNAPSIPSNLMTQLYAGVGVNAAMNHADKVGSLDKDQSGYPDNDHNRIIDNALSALKSEVRMKRSHGDAFSHVKKEAM
mmetsp:Transcript_7914/g.10065  ORF Transcript_7914/g.10065 Transcript_7914/m.10065 type:complete len:529 (+) Transcript_7914:121-1707(+)